MDELTGSVWSLKDKNDHYVLLVLGQAFKAGDVRYWRCLVLMDANGQEVVGSTLNYDSRTLKEDFDRV